MCGNSIFSTSHWKVIQLRSVFLGDLLEPNLRPCSWNNNRVNENQKYFFQIAKIASIGLDISRGKAPNTRQKKVMVRSNFWNFYSANSITIVFPISGAIFQIDESTDRQIDR